MGRMQSSTTMLINRRGAESAEETCIALLSFTSSAPLRSFHRATLNHFEINREPSGLAKAHIAASLSRAKIFIHKIRDGVDGIRPVVTLM
jgi:hypothetical protein